MLVGTLADHTLPPSHLGDGTAARRGAEVVAMVTAEPRFDLIVEKKKQ